MSGRLNLYGWEPSQLGLLNRWLLLLERLLLLQLLGNRWDRRHAGLEWLLLGRLGLEASSLRLETGELLLKLRLLLGGLQPRVSRELLLERLLLLLTIAGRLWTKAGRLGSEPGRLRRKPGRLRLHRALLAKRTRGAVLLLLLLRLLAGTKAVGAPEEGIRVRVHDGRFLLVDITRCNSMALVSGLGVSDEEERGLGLRKRTQQHLIHDEGKRGFKERRGNWRKGGSKLLLVGSHGMGVASS